MNAVICHALEKAFPPLDPVNAAVENYNAINTRMRAAIDPDKREALKLELEEAAKLITKAINS